MSRYNYNNDESEASGDEVPDKDSSGRITIPNKFGLKVVDNYGLMCEELSKIHRDNISRRYETMIIPHPLRQQHSHDFFDDCEPNYIDERSLTIHGDSENCLQNQSKSKVLRHRGENTSEKSKVNPDEAGCSSQTGKRTNFSDINDIKTYELEKFSKNLMIIFNHENFLEGNDRREGSAVDVASLRNTFEKLRFDVTVHKDLDEAELFSTLKEFSGQDFSACGCVCVAVLTHGSDHGFLAACDEWYSERRLLASFSALANRTLADKPIILLIQACRGPTLARPVPFPEPSETPTIQLDNAKSSGRVSLPAESNMIIFHSTFPGRASARDRGAGSWFIQTLCQQLEQFAAREDVEQIFLRVRDIVSRKEAGGGKQMPISSSALTKKLFLI